MKTILAPVDFSVNSSHAAEFAAMLAKKTGARLHLLNVVLKFDYFVTADPMFYTPPATLLIENTDEKLRKHSLKNLQKLRKKKLFNGIRLTVESRSSASIHDEIINYASEIKADVIVIGSKGANRLKNILLGSNAERVVRFSERPVVVIPEKMHKLAFNLLVFATDLSKEAYGIFPFVRTFAKVLGADIQFLRINTIDQFMSTPENKKLFDEFNGHFHTKYKLVVYDDYMKEEGILHYSEEVKASIIAIGTHGKKGLSRFFASDVSGGMVRLTHKPILIVNLKKFKPKADVR